MGTNVIGWVVMGVVVVLVVWFMMQSTKKSWWKVEMADESVLILIRSQKDMFWSNNSVLIFRTETGRMFKTNWHWVKSLEQIPEAELNRVREQLREREKRLAEKA